MAFAQRRAENDPKSRGWAGLVVPYLPLAIDIRPGSEPNVILPEAGVLVVGISAARTPGFDDLDPASLRLAGLSPFQTAWRDFDHDGRLDLQLYFDARRISPRQRPPGWR